ncbi:MAG: alpha/beta hydrolase [Chloracidobacterium sp.]|uniref:Alpha/beta hydrolase n=1 Tax=Chloracidobacterium validum TaxID=2821543 RepID=A0ABX8B629_9BACT|nr:alpha/beta hydrolase [Chloracidobacterium validum]QUW02104.1 alpha/beta hydrolase [Chloracidobacterium validum]
MPLHPQAEAFLNQVAALGNPPLWTLAPEQARQAFLALRALAGPPEPVAKVDHRLIRGSQASFVIRTYTPEHDGPLPMTVYFHGGGFVIGNLDSHDNVCRALANRTPTLVVSVDYRLAPEHPFPAAPIDAYDAVQWVVAHAEELGGDPARVAVAGDSAGANLATVAALMARNRKGHLPIFQLLVYPVTDATHSQPSYEENGEGYFLTKEAMQWFLGHYVPPDQDKRHPYLSPLFEKDLSGLPPAHIIVAEYDPLRDEGTAYAQRLEQAGVAVSVSHYAGMVHGFFSLIAHFDDARRALDESAAALRQAFTG